MARPAATAATGAEQERLVCTAEELLLTAAEVVQRHADEPPPAADAGWGQHRPAAAPGAREHAAGGRWRNHRADVWAAYGGLLTRSKRDFPAAVRAYSEALKVNPRHAVALEEYAELAATHLQAPRIAEFLYRQLVDVKAGDVAVWLAYAGVLQDLNNEADAAKAYKRALQMQPDSAAALCSYGALLQSAQRDCDGAELLYTRALAVQPDHTATLSNYALLVEEARGDYPAAEALLRRALAVDPADSTVLCHLALLRQDAFKDVRGAHDLLSAALSSAPSSLTVLSNMATFQYSAQRNLDYADKLFRRALAIKPDDVGTLINYASLLEEGRRDRGAAQELLDLALAIDPAQASRYIEQRGGDAAGGGRAYASEAEEGTLGDSFEGERIEVLAG